MMNAANQYWKILHIEGGKKATEYYDACENIFDDELVNKLENPYIFEKLGEFLEQYCVLHKDKYNEEFIVN